MADSQESRRQRDSITELLETGVLDNQEFRAEIARLSKRGAAGTTIVRDEFAAGATASGAEGAMR